MPVDVSIALLGYGNVGSAVARLLAESADDIERATGHRLRIVRALVRDVERERGHLPDDGVLTTDFASIRDDPQIGLVAELMGGLEPAGEYVLDLLRAGKPVVSANKQLIARRGAELFATASESGVQLRFEASVCAAIPVIKVLRESLVATNVHSVLGIVNGTTNFILSQMEQGDEYGVALAEAQRLGFAEADPTDDLNGADAAAKMAILAATGHGDPAGPWLPVGAGVNTGVAFVGAVGEPPVTELTALGDVVNTAARLASAAATGELLVTEAAIGAAGWPTTGLESRSLELKGKRELTGVRVARVPIAASRP
jgi:class 3 adenylate cyclase